MSVAGDAVGASSVERIRPVVRSRWWIIRWAARSRRGSAYPVSAIRKEESIFSLPWPGVTRAGSGIRFDCALPVLDKIMNAINQQPQWRIFIESQSTMIG